MEISRAIATPYPADHSFFLWGPRQAGKTYYLKKRYPQAHFINLLKSSEFIKYQQRPGLLVEVVRELPEAAFVIIDEVQKVPQLLDEVHNLIEEDGRVFGLCGSSARKLKRNQANLLGGRALRYELFGLTCHELGEGLDLNKLVNRGNIHNHYFHELAWELLESYVADYLKEEIFAEALVRNLPSFSDFLRAAAIGDTETVEYTNIASDCGVKSPTVKNYYEIMEDTFQGFFLHAYTRAPKRRVIHTPKFYFANVGVVNWLAKRRLIEPGSPSFGKAFENIIVNEVVAWNAYGRHNLDLRFWKLASGEEVDVVLEEIGLAIEIKSSSKIHSKHLKGLRELVKDHPRFTTRIVVCLEEGKRKTEDDIRILNVKDFVHELWEGAFLA